MYGGRKKKLSISQNTYTPIDVFYKDVTAKFKEKSIKLEKINKILIE